MSTGITNQSAPFNLPDSSAPSDVFDIELAMEYSGGDQQILDELIGSMLEETPRLMERIRLAIEQLDGDALRQEAHTLKGSIAMVGATDVSASAERLEVAANDNGLESVGKLHNDLQLRIDTLLDALETHVRECLQ